MSENSALYNATMHFIGGTLGGMTGVAASYPLDTIKVGPCFLRCVHLAWHQETLSDGNACPSLRRVRSVCKRRP